MDPFESHCALNSPEMDPLHDPADILSDFMAVLGLLCVCVAVSPPPLFASRRAALLGASSALCVGSTHGGLAANAYETAVRMDGINGPGKSKTLFPDFELTSSGLQYKDYKIGSGPKPRPGDRVVLEWTGVTVGYQGRYFETRNKPKGGAFADDGFLQPPLAFTCGDGAVIAGIDEAVRGMNPGSEEPAPCASPALPGGRL